ncbi:MAG: penicillin-binding transpeptidase domain-containing protein [Terracidiphilus sp.]|nr:penicillin-binding transpeptidase domain-containing protein [Terracidiphilus sp.]
MKSSRVRFLGTALVVAVFAVCGLSAAAFDAPRTPVHHVKPQSRLRVTAHHAVTHATKSTATHTATTHSTSSRVTKKSTTTSAHVQRVSVGRRHHYYERFTASSFVKGEIGADDVTAGEDPVVRQAAIEALGDMNGTALVIDPSNGRILAMVNQKLALSPGAEPCSTIKLTVALAGLSEGLVTRDTPVQLAGFRMNMTQALAKSNNLYFEEIGRELGFERVRHYATQFGLGELAGYNIPGEQLGVYPDQPIPESQGGVARMCSFGQGVSLTPLQLGAFVASIANGGTLYYLQHPTTPEEVAAFQPRVKRTLDIARYVPDLEDGMAGAVEYGTARRLRANFNQLPVFGKTGTCSNDGTRYGWFASYSETPQGALVTVFFLEGGRPTFGPRAAELTGEFYKNLWDRDYFAVKNQDAQNAPAAAPAGNSTPAFPAPAAPTPAEQ